MPDNKKRNIQPQNMDIRRIIYSTTTNYITIYYKEIRMYDEINVEK